MSAWLQRCRSWLCALQGERVTTRSASLRPALLCAVALLVLLELSGSYLACRISLPASAEAAAEEPDRTAEQWQLANRRLLKKIAGQRPQDPYLVVDTAQNRVILRKGEIVLRDMPASCGSGKVLEDSASGRRWVFDTPRGQHRIQSKVANPIWIKPDWAFLEAGQPIPADHAQRAEAGALGDYALGIGNGYFIHGTLYKRMLGRSVSHGCVRLGDEDLAHLYNTLPLGTRVFIF